MPEFVIEKRNIPVLTISSRDGAPSTGSENGDNPLGFRITGGADFEMPITVFQVSMVPEPRCWCGSRECLNHPEPVSIGGAATSPFGELGVLREETTALANTET
ncbi:AGAP003937-PC-like protein [Anopheles sinensis]|uniref:AGAP003937-PC-like protein n=1 Tax=Anopheles sinensis TaxID=74873 RepID=A0A084WQW7_ANOSI|nr:AGAP003937-PC-like protein [Anopheles sinensis]